MKKINFLLFCGIFIGSTSFAQTGVAISAADNPTTVPSAMLDVTSTTKGVLEEGYGGVI